MGRIVRDTETITAGAGMSKTGNTIDVGTASSTRIVVNTDNIDLATTGVSAGTYNSLAVDIYGRVTSGSSIAYLTANQSISLTGDITGSGTTSIATTLANTSVTAASYGSSSKTLTITVDSKGRLTAASASDISITASQVSDFSTSVRGLLSGSSGVSYNSSTGAFTLDNSAVRGLFSQGTGISYNSSTGAIAVDSTVITSANSIDKLSDVNTTSVVPVANNILYWNGTYWRPGNQPFPTSALGNITGPIIFDASSASHFSATLTGTVTAYFTADTTTPVNVIMMELTNPGAYSITWPTSVKWPGGSPPTFTVSGVDLLVFISRDGGTTWRGTIIQQDSR
jgi:hypothetical protein